MERKEIGVRGGRRTKLGEKKKRRGENRRKRREE